MELQDVKWNGQAREIQAVAGGEFSAAAEARAEG
jgi:hypothetical protein